MSATANDAGRGASTSTLPTEAGIKRPYKSWRKKYRKMRVKFDDMMRESNAIYREEQRAMELLRRLQEQKYQLLELLLDVNDSEHLPPKLRYELDEVRKDRLGEGGGKEEVTRQSIGSNHTRSLSFLVKGTPESKMHNDQTSSSDSKEVPLPFEYFTLPQEDEYLLQLDASLGDPSANRALSSHPPRPNVKNMSQEEETEDTTLNNPVSVYNWLKKNEPQIFTHTEGTLERSIKKKKRETLAANPTPTAAATPVPDLEHDDQNDGGLQTDIHGQSAKAKRLRDDDSAYRPKGGASRSMKRKRKDPDGGGSVKKAKTGATAPDAY